MDLKIRFVKMSPAAVAPTRAHESDAGFDLTAVSLGIDEHGNLVYGTGLAVEIPAGYVGLIFPRSSIANKSLYLTNSVGVIDSGYRGEITMKFKPAQEFTDVMQGNVLYKDWVGRRNLYGLGDRVGQLIILPCPTVEFEEVYGLSESDRGTGGYGSTGE